MWLFNADAPITKFTVIYNRLDSSNLILNIQAFLYICIMNQHNTEGKQHGYWEQYWERTGNLWRKCNFVNGFLNGPYEEYRHDGTLWRKSNYLNDVENGEAEYYWDNGNLRTKVLYLNGEEIGYSECFKETGDLEDKEFHL